MSSSKKHGDLEVSDKTGREALIDANRAASGGEQRTLPPPKSAAAFHVVNSTGAPSIHTC